VLRTFDPRHPGRDDAVVLEEVRVLPGLGVANHRASTSRRPSVSKKVLEPKHFRQRIQGLDAKE
jgi:hypothetical protein